MEAHSANILRKSGRGASREGFSMFGPRGIPCGGVYVRAGRIPGRGFLCSGRGVSRAGGYMFGPVASPCGARVPAWTLCSGGAGRISVRVAAVSGRAGRIPRTQGLPSSRAAPSGRGPMLRFRTLFVLFCSVPPRRNRRRLQIRGFAAREKRKSCFFIFTL